MTKQSKHSFIFRGSLLACGLGVALAGCDKPPDSGAVQSPDATVATNDATAPVPVATKHQTITVLTFDSEGTLYFGDSGTGKLHAVTPPARDNPLAQAAYNVKNLDTKLAAALGTTPDRIRVRDLAVNPKSKEAYLAVVRASGDSYGSAILVVDQAGEVRMLDLSTDVKEVQVPFAPSEEFEFYGEVPGRDLTFTDLDVHKGKLYVSGLSNAEFASTLWTIPATLEGDIAATKTEIYHAVHNQTETRAPIRTMAIVEFDNVDYVVAAYTCTPLVVFPLSDLQDGAKVRGKTIAELGYGNTPVDLFQFTTQDAQQNKADVLFVQNKNQSAQVIGLPRIAKALQEPGLSKPVALGAQASLGAAPVPMTDLIQIDDQDPMRILGMRRDLDEGDLELVSFMKGAYFRLSDFQSEYEIPGYTYSKEQQGIKQYQNMLKKDEGHPDSIVQ